MKIKLVSDFNDYYDHYFDITDCEVSFSRKTTDGPDRLEMFQMLKAMGFDPPPYGYIKDIYSQTLEGFKDADPKQLDEYLNAMEFVVYTDPRAHCGEGKVKLSLKEAFEKHPDCFASKYFQTTPNGMGHTIRMLAIGGEQVWLTYRSKNDWRSNAGDVEISLLNNESEPEIKHIQIPLFAIDFVPMLGYRGDRNIYAIDLNLAPGLKGTPVEEILKPQDAAKLIKDKVASLLSGW